MKTPIALTLAWVLLWGQIDLGTLVVGALLSWGLNRYLPPDGLHRLSRVRWRHLPGFLGWLLLDVAKSNFRVAWEVVTPPLNMKPAFLALDVSDLDDDQATLAAVCITLTPGTLSLELDRQRQVLILHALYAPDTEAAVAGLRATVVEQVRKVLP
jgi:multicomponent Na+:H+ antiporter subunit E